MSVEMTVAEACAKVDLCGEAEAFGIHDIGRVLRRAVADHDRRVTELLTANNREVERRRVAETQACALGEEWRQAQDWYRRNETAIRAAGIEAPPDFLVPF